MLHTSNTRRRPRPGETVTRNRNAGRWSAQEHARFVDGLEKYGRRKWIRIAEHVGTRTVIQVRSHAQKYFKKTAAAQPPPARKVSSDDEVSLARAAAVPNLDARPQLALLTAAAKLLDGVAERPAARAPIEMERKRARSDDSDESFVRGVSPDAGLPACVSSDTLHVVGGNNTPPSPPRALHGPVVSNADLPDLAKRRKVDEPLAGGGAAAPRGRVTTIPRANYPGALSSADLIPSSSSGKARSCAPVFPIPGLLRSRRASLRVDGAPVARPGWLNPRHCRNRPRDGVVSAGRSPAEPRTAGG